MTQPDDQAAGYPQQPDHDAILAAMQDQIDDLTAALTAQQASIDALLGRLRALETRSGQLPGQ